MYKVCGRAGAVGIASARKPKTGSADWWVPLKYEGQAEGCEKVSEKGAWWFAGPALPWCLKPPAVDVPGERHWIEMAFPHFWGLALHPSPFFLKAFNSHSWSPDVWIKIVFFSSNIWVLETRNKRMFMKTLWAGYSMFSYLFPWKCLCWS